MTVSQILEALGRIGGRASSVLGTFDERPRTSDGRATFAASEMSLMATRVAEIRRIAELTRDLIEMEGLQLLETPTQPARPE